MDPGIPRRRLRFNLKTMLLGLAAFGLVWAGILSGDPRWAAIVSCLFAGVLVLAAAAAFFGAPAARPYWFSFLAAALMYILLALFPIRNVEGVPTTTLLDELQKHIGMIQAQRHADPGFEVSPLAPSFQAYPSGPREVVIGANANGFPRVWYVHGSRDTTQRIGHCVFALMFGWIVAEVAQFLLRRQQARYAQHAILSDASRGKT